MKKLEPAQNPKQTDNHVAQETDWEAQDIGSKINAQVIAITAALNDAWRKELISLNLPGIVLNRLWLETSFFGAFLLIKRFTKPLENTRKEKINSIIRDGYLLIVPDMFGSDKVEKKQVQDYFASEYDKTLEMYEKYEGVDTKTLFCGLVKNVFNASEGSKVKFIDNSFKNRLGLKTAFFLAALGGNKEFMNKHANEVFIPRERLSGFADDVVKAFSGVNEGDVFE